jgi:hypothetical protein
MKKLTPLLFLPLIFSCGEESTTEESQKARISYSIDTVIIDSNEDFLFLKHDLSTSGVSKDRRFFYNIDELGSRLEVIDLDSLILKEKIPLEREGPNGVGPEHISNFQVLDNGNFCFYNVHKITVFSPDLKKLTSHYFYPEVFENDTLPEGSEIPIMLGRMNGKGSRFASLNSIFFENEILGIALVDLEKNELKLIPTDKLDYLKELIYTTVYENGSKIHQTEGTVMDFFEDKLLISTTAKNEVLIYDPEKDSLESKSFKSKFTADIKKGNFKAESNSDLASRMRELEVYYGRLVFDESNGVFWRYSRESKSSNPDSPDFEYVLTAFDKDLNQIHEEKLEVDWMHVPLIKFVKDGMLYTYLNMEDELAFLRLKPTFHEN